MKKNVFKIVMCGLLVGSISVGACFHASADTIEERQQKANELESQKNAAESEQSALVAQLNTIVSEMTEAQTKLTAKQEEIDQAETELVAAKVEENTQYQSMKMRIRYMYENGQFELIQVLLSSDNISDFLNKAEYVSQLSDYDRKKLVEFQEIVKSVEEREENLRNEYAQLEVLQNELIAKQDSVNKLLEENQLKLADLQQQIGENASVLATLIADAETARLIQEQAAAASSSSGYSSYAAASSGNVVSGNGQFTNPCPSGTVSSTFGYRDFDASFHKGLDLAASTGTPTYAGDAGTVIIAGWSSSAGNWVVIDHGNGFVTKYMHHSAICVTAGQTVQRGQQIGYVGSTGNSSGPHLHFQVELNGTAVNPQLYL